MILPNVEKTPLLLVRFTSQASQRLITLVREQLQAEGLIILPNNNKKVGNNKAFSYNDEQDDDKAGNKFTTILALTTSQEKLEEQAERIRLLKLTRDTNIMDYFTVEQRQRFCDKKNARYRDQYGLFTANEWYLLTTRILQSVTVLPQGQSESSLSRLLDEYHAEYRVSVVKEQGKNGVHLLGDDDEDYDNGDDGKRGFHKHRRMLKEYGERSAVLLHVLETYDLVDVVTPLHIPALRNEVLSQILKPSYPFLGTAEADEKSIVHAIQSYYGWELAFYFAWMGFLTRWLFFPGIIGLLFFFSRIYRQDTIDNDEWTPFFGLIIFVWAILFARFWERYEQRLAYRWGTFELERGFLATRAEFRGFVRISPVTMQPEMYYPATRRRIKYILSSIVTIFMLAVAFSVMILSLNLQGYIHPKTNPIRWKKSPHPFYFESWAALAEEGQLLDAKSSWRCFIPVILHVVCIMTLNFIYRHVAERLTNFENHETAIHHNNSLILKRFLFEAFDCYVALFYLAFYERDVEKLRMELIAVFQIDTARRVVLECIVPLILQRISTGHFAIPKPASVVGSSSSTSTTEEQTRSMNDLLEEADKDPYEMFDDVMEMCIQLGYVTLFASAYPLASAVSIFANYIELRSDAVKVGHLVKKPPAFRAAGFGMWNTLVSCILWTSALTNCLIAGFTSDQLVFYFPSFYTPEDEETGYADLGQSNKSWILVFIIFGLERCLLLIGLLIHAIVPKVPEDVMEELERRHFLRQEEQVKLQKQRREKQD